MTTNSGNAEVQRIVDEVVAGDAARVDFLAKRPPSELAQDTGDRTFVLTADAVCRVLSGLAAGGVRPEVAQRWASFVRRGYVGGTESPPATPIEIGYEQERESQLADAIDRLDQLGDSIDGTLRAVDIEHIRRSLGCPAITTRD